MKTKLIILALFIFIGKVQAQEKSFNHFDVGLSVIFWTPTSLHINSNNSVTQFAYPDGSYASTGSISGYGTSLAPALDVKYYPRLRIRQLHDRFNLQIHSNFSNKFYLPKK